MAPDCTIFLLLRTFPRVWWISSVKAGVIFWKLPINEQDKYHGQWISFENCHAMSWAFYFSMICPWTGAGRLQVISSDDYSPSISHIQPLALLLKKINSIILCLLLSLKSLGCTQLTQVRKVIFPWTGQIILIWPVLWLKILNVKMPLK
jgi:hypothetical protein